MNNALRVAYPESRTSFGKVFRPVVDLRTYLRTVHLFAMFPLGIAYFVSLVTTLALGGSLIWTFPGALIVLLAIFASRLVGDFEAFVVGKVSDIEIRRPPWRTEGVEGWRSRLWIRLIDPTTWTGIVYLFVQFPLGIGAFAALVSVFSVSGSFIASPLIIALSDETFELNLGFSTLLFDRPIEAIWLVPVGLLVLLLAAHLVNVLSALHATWARFMLGSRIKAVRETAEPDSPPEPPGPGERASVYSDEETSPPIAASAVRPIGAVAPEASLAAVTKFSPANSGVTEDKPPPVVPMDKDLLPSDITQREHEILLLLARGMTNAEIAEECVISQGTVKTHVKRILAKLQLNDRTQVVVFAYEIGLVTPKGNRSSQFVASR